MANSFVLTVYPPEVMRSNIACTDKPVELLPMATACVDTDLFELTFQRKEGQILRRLKKRSVELFASCVKKHIFLAFFRGCSAPCFVSNVLKPFLPRVDWISDLFLAL